MNVTLSTLLIAVSGFVGLVVGKWTANEPQQYPTVRDKIPFSYSFTGTVEDVRDDGYAMVKLEKLVGVKLKWTIPYVDDFSAAKDFAKGKNVIISTQLPITSFVNGLPDSMESESVSVEGTDLIALIQNSSLTPDDTKSNTTGGTTSADSNAGHN